MDQLSSDDIYVCEYRKLRQIDPGVQLPPLICVIEHGVTPIESLLNTRKVIAVYSSTTPEVLSILSEKMFNLEAKTNYPNEALKELQSCRSLEELVLAGFRILNNPIVVTDEYHQIVAATPPAMISDELYRDMCNRAYLPEGIPSVESERTGWRYMQFQKQDENTVSPESPMLCYALNIRGRIVGCIHITLYTGPFTEEQYSIAELIGNLIAMELWLHRSYMGNTVNGRQELEHFLRDMLDGNEMPSEQLAARRERIRFELKSYLYAMVLVLPNNKPETVTPLHELIEQLNGHMPELVGFTYRRHIVVLVNSRIEVWDFEQLLAPIWSILQKYEFFVGVSNRFFSLEKFSHAVYQAKMAVTLGHLTDTKQTVYLFQKYQLTYILYSCIRDGELDHICLPAAGALLEYCTNSGPANLIETFNVFMQLGMNKAKTAKELGIHVNTVKYRLTQIELTTGLNLSNTDEAFGLMLSLKALDLHRVFSENTALLNW